MEWELPMIYRRPWKHRKSLKPTATVFDSVAELLVGLFWKWWTRIIWRRNFVVTIQSVAQQRNRWKALVTPEVFLILCCCLAQPLRLECLLCTFVNFSNSTIKVSINVSVFEVLRLFCKRSNTFPKRNLVLARFGLVLSSSANEIETLNACLDC